MDLLFDCQEIDIFLLENFGQASKMWQHISLEIDGSNKAVGRAGSIETLGYWTLVGFCLLRQDTEYCTEVSLQSADSHVLRQPACVLHLLKNISVIKIKDSGRKYVYAQ